VEFPEELGDLAGEVGLQGGVGVEVIEDFVEVDLVGGVAFAGEEGGWGAAVFAGVLEDGFLPSGVRGLVDFLELGHETGTGLVFFRVMKPGRS
jgi:hypothetical protein